MSKPQSFLVLPDDTTWPNPHDPNEVQWRLRYGTPTRSDLLVAAEVMAAYRALVHATSHRRAEVVRHLKPKRRPR